MENFRKSYPSASFKSKKEKSRSIAYPFENKLVLKIEVAYSIKAGILTFRYVDIFF